MTGDKCSTSVALCSAWTRVGRAESAWRAAWRAAHSRAQADRATATTRVTCTALRTRSTRPRASSPTARTCSTRHVPCRSWSSRTFAREHSRPRERSAKTLWPRAPLPLQASVQAIVRESTPRSPPMDQEKRKCQLVTRYRARLLLRPTRNQRWSVSMECAIGRASRAMALPDFMVVGPAIHLALPNYF